jgi:putative nucleotidyltransferase with HDIG domain
VNTKWHSEQDPGGVCRSRVASIVSRGLEPLPSCVFDLDALLTERIVDLTKVMETFSNNSEFSRRALRLSNTILAGSKEFAPNLEEAVILLGPCLFHAVVLLCGVTEVGSHLFRDENADAIWLHSVQMAILSEQLAEQAGYPFRGAACVAGLLHDIGYLPLLAAAREEASLGGGAGVLTWRDDVALERQIFGVDHCQLGEWMAKSWKFPPSLIDAVSHHHDPSKAKPNMPLTEIVCAAERHCPAPSRRAIAKGARLSRNPIAHLRLRSKFAEA